MTFDPPVCHIADRTYRLIPSRYPTVGVFDDVATPEDLAAVFELEGWTNDRLNAEYGKLLTLPREEWVTGMPGATIIMAAFCHPNPDGARFTTGELGAWYAALDVTTAIEETVYHNAKRLVEASMLNNVRIQLRALIADLDAMFHDVRGAETLGQGIYHDSDYTHSQALGQRLREGGSNGIVYNSVRRVEGQCVVVLRPRVIPAVRQAAYYEYRWSGAFRPDIKRINIE